MEKTLEEKVVTYQLLQRYLEGLGEQLNLLQNRLLELNSTQQALQDFLEMKEGKETFVNLGSGCWVMTRLEKPETVLLNLGAGIFARRKVERAREMLSERARLLEKEIEKLQTDMALVSKKLSEMGREIEGSLQA